MFNLLKIFIIAQSIIGCKQTESATYLIPEGFKGKVNIIFNQPNGAAPKYDNGRRVYEIPISGILLTQFKDEYGLVDHQYYYFTSTGKRALLKKLKDDSFNDSTLVNDRGEVGVFHDGTVGVYGNSNDPKSLKYEEFFVTDFNSLDSFFTEENKKAFNNRLKAATGSNVLN